MNIRDDLYYGWVHPVAHVTISKYNNLIHIFMLVLAIDVVYTYFNSIDFSNRQKFLTQIQRIRILNDSLHLVFCIQ
jgi:hypothetical protein